MKINRLVIISMIILLLDQMTKQIVRINQIRTTEHFLDITYLTNEGSLFSLFAGTNFVNLFFILLSFIAVGVLIYLIKTEETNLKISYFVILSGIIGNLTDRIFFGAVIDFINFHFWPVFNVADAAIVSGVIIAIILKEKDKNKT